MSDTPITDAEAYDYETGRRWLDGVVSAHIVRKLERENAALRADKERLDWLALCPDKRISAVHDLWVNDGDIADMRAAIDAARKEKP
jgi:hypothetical protein